MISIGSDLRVGRVALSIGRALSPPIDTWTPANLIRADQDGFWADISNAVPPFSPGLLVMGQASGFWADIAGGVK